MLSQLRIAGPCSSYGGSRCGDLNGAAASPHRQHERSRAFEAVAIDRRRMQTAQACAWRHAAGSLRPQASEIPEGRLQRRFRAGSDARRGMSAAPYLPRRGRSASKASRVGGQAPSPDLAARGLTPTRQHLLRSEANAVDLPLSGGGISPSTPPDPYAIALPTAAAKSRTKWLAPPLFRSGSAP